MGRGGLRRLGVLDLFGVGQALSENEEGIRDIGHDCLRQL